MREIPVLYKKKEECCGCGACYAACPKNAITMEEDETTHIKVTVSFDESFLYLTVEDDGYGMKESKVEELRKRLLATNEYKGVGIKNVYDRLRVYCGEQADITIESKVEVGTKITIKIPKAKARVNDEAD